jgi:hypothetical protein
MIKHRSDQNDFAYAKGWITVKEKELVEKRGAPAYQSDIHDVNQKE